MKKLKDPDVIVDIRLFEPPRLLVICSCLLVASASITADIFSEIGLGDVLAPFPQASNGHWLDYLYT